jgi:alcohol dehydrogenase
MEHLLRKLLHKLYLALMTVVVRLSPSPKHMVFVGANSSEQLCAHISRLGPKKVLLVTDKPLVDLGLASQVLASLKKYGLEAVVFDGVLPDPTYQIVEDGLSVLRKHDCDAVLAMGGGSVIDAAKVMAMAVTNPGDLSSFVGYFKAKQATLPLFAIPTTSGTGSEATMAAVISDTVTHEKSIIADPKLCPQCTALDAGLMTGLPARITAATGMDALTHAIEAYIGVWGNDRSNAHAKAAVKMIFEKLPVAYNEGSNIEAREQMALAAYYAGLAVGEVNVGNVHAIAHQLGAKYSLPHGLANAIVLPHVLNYSKYAAQDAMADLAILLQLGSVAESNDALTDKFIVAVIELNSSIDIPCDSTDLRREDIAGIAKAAVKEGAGYPVPILMSQQDCEGILSRLITSDHI